MRLQDDMLKEAFDWIHFTPVQRQAIMRTYECYLASPQAQQMACADMEALSNPEGPCQLLSDPQALRALYGPLDAVYPVLILLSGIRRLKAQYQSHRISLEIMADALQDIPLWMENYQARVGCQGIREYAWLTNHMRFRLFRLGRLEYIYNRSRVPAYAYQHKFSGAVCFLAQEGMRYTDTGAVAAPEEEGWTAWVTTNEEAVTGFPIHPMGYVQSRPCSLPCTTWEMMLQPADPILDVHIPEGPPLDFEEIRSALEQAPLFYRQKLGIRDMQAFTCGSWLMSPALPRIVPGSRIAAFQSLFHCVPYTVRDNQVFDRVYGKPFSRWEDMPCHTRLQKGIRDWYLTGGNCRQMQGVLLILPDT